MKMLMAGWLAAGLLAATADEEAADMAFTYMGTCASGRW